LFNSVPYYLRAATTATRPNTETAQEKRENTQTQATNENMYKRGNKKSHIRITANLLTYLLHRAESLRS